MTLTSKTTSNIHGVVEKPCHSRNFKLTIFSAKKYRKTKQQKSWMRAQCKKSTKITKWRKKYNKRRANMTWEEQELHTYKYVREQHRSLQKNYLRQRECWSCRTISVNDKTQVLVLIDDSRKFWNFVSFHLIWRIDFSCAPCTRGELKEIVLSWILYLSRGSFILWSLQTDKLIILKTYLSCYCFSWQLTLYADCRVNDDDNNIKPSWKARATTCLRSH